MSKLSQLCSYLERPDANELAFAVGAPAVVRSNTRDLPVTVAPLNARAIYKFFDGTDVAPFLVGGDKTKDVNFELDGRSLSACVVKKGVQLSVTVRIRGAVAAKAPVPTPRSPELREPRPNDVRGIELDTNGSPRPRPLDLPSLEGPEARLPRTSVAPKTASTKAASPHEPMPWDPPSPAREAVLPPPEADPAPIVVQPARVAVVEGSSVGLGHRLAPHRVAHRGAPRLDAMLRQMVEIGASDLHLSAESRPIVRLHGKMQPLDGHPSFSPAAISEILLEIVDDDAYRSFVENADADFAYAIRGLARFRANYFADRKGMGAVFRQIPMEILPPEAIGLPPKVLDLCWLSKGLVLVTGPTGSGKSTTLASMIDFINRNRDDHIITIEDPIEFVHENKRCLINQREVGRHTRSFKSALRAALREDPDVILVGELRDLETIHIALETAETGHLVFGTLHTTTAPSTVDRLIDQFPGDQQAQIRTMLGGSLRGVIGQTLLRRKVGGRVAAYEILLHTSAIGNLIREGKTHQLKNTMQVSKYIGMQNLNDHLIELVKDGTVEAREAYLKAVDKQNLVQMFQKHAIEFDAPTE